MFHRINVNGIFAYKFNLVFDNLYSLELLYFTLRVTLVKMRNILQHIKHHKD